MSDQGTTETPKPMTDFEAYQYNLGMMNQIVREMREIPELPSEAPKDVNPLLRVEFPEAGGVLTYMGGHDHPYKGFPFFEFVDKIDLIKKISRAFLSGIYHALKGRAWLAITFIPAMWFARSILRVGVYVFYRMVERFRIKSIRYCDAIRELYRAFSEGFDPDEKTHEFRIQVRDLVCMFLEFDNAYRYRIQDVLPELDKEALRKHPRRELIRLCDLMASRETTQEIRDTWKLLKICAEYYLLFDRKTLRLVVDTLSRIDLEKITLSVEDKQFCRPRTDYNFKFVTEEKNVSN